MIVMNDEAKKGIVMSPLEPNKKNKPRKMTGHKRCQTQRIRRKPKAIFSSIDSIGPSSLMIQVNAVLRLSQILRFLRLGEIPS